MNVRRFCVTVLKGIRAKPAFAGLVGAFAVQSHVPAPDRGRPLHPRRLSP